MSSLGREDLGCCFLKRAVCAAPASLRGQVGSGASREGLEEEEAGPRAG